MAVNYKPNSVVWEITWKCNANCIHCGSDCVSREKPNQLTTNECLGIIKDLYRIGAKKVTLSGGDPLLREDFPILAEEIKKYNMDLAFITNGIALDDAKIKLIKELKPRSFGISIDGADEYIHDYIRGHKGCLNNALESLIKLRQVGIIPSVVTTVHKLNYPQLPLLRDMLIIIGVGAWQIQYADFIGRMDQSFMITEAQFKKIAEFIYETQQQYGRRIYVTGADVTGYMDDLSKKIGMTNWQGCQAGMRVLGLGSDGSVRGCLSQQIDKYIEGNIRERSLYDIWNDPNSFSYNRNFDINTLGGYCRECGHAQICKGGCSRSATNHSDFRCNRYCLYKISKCGFSDEYNSKTYFTKDEIASIYSKVRLLPDEFYEKYVYSDDILGK